MPDAIDAILDSLLAEDGPLTEEDMEDVRQFDAAIAQGARESEWARKKLMIGLINRLHTKSPKKKRDAAERETVA